MRKTRFLGSIQHGGGSGAVDINGSSVQDLGGLKSILELQHHEEESTPDLIHQMETSSQKQKMMMINLTIKILVCW